MYNATNRPGTNAVVIWHGARERRKSVSMRPGAKDGHEVQHANFKLNRPGATAGATRHFAKEDATSEQGAVHMVLHEG